MLSASSLPFCVMLTIESSTLRVLMGRIGASS